MFPATLKRERRMFWAAGRPTERTEKREQENSTPSVELPLPPAHLIPSLQGKTLYWVINHRFGHKSKTVRDLTSHLTGIQEWDTSENTLESHGIEIMAHKRESEMILQYAEILSGVQEIDGVGSFCATQRYPCDVQEVSALVTCSGDPEQRPERVWAWVQGQPAGAELGPGQGGLQSTCGRAPGPYTQVCPLKKWCKMKTENKKPKQIIRLKIIWEMWSLKSWKIPQT